jgi:hypothetical protein
MNFGSASVLPCTISAVGLLCRIMFMRARPLVAPSFSCPYSVTFALASSPPSAAANRSRRWGRKRWWRRWLASRMPMICAMMRLTSAGRVELALALAALGGEVPHQVFVGVAQNVVAVGAVLREVERRVFEDGDQVAEPIHHLLPFPSLFGSLKSGKSLRRVLASISG